MKNRDADKSNTAQEKPEAEFSENFLEKEREQSISEVEFYRKQVVDEVAFLQIVEHVFAGVEREQLKTIPRPYNDFEVKKVLHNFLHVAPKADINERSKVEFQLLQETESWH